MRAVSQAIALIVVMAVPAFGQLSPSESPARAPTLIGAARNATPVAPGTSRANLEIADTTAIDIAAAPLVCEALDPNACPALPEVTGFADTTLPWNAEQLHGRVLLVRNTGTGVLVLKGEGTGSAAHWRLSGRRVLRPSDVVVLVYDGPQARWRVVGTR